MGLIAAIFVALRIAGVGGLAFGPPEAEALDFTVAPGVAVEIVPSARSLATSHFDAFDVSTGGAVAVTVGPNLFDMRSGEKLLSDDQEVSSFAFVGEALALIDGQGQLAFYEDGRARIVGAPPVSGAPRIVASSDRTRLLFFRSTDGASGDIPALAALTAEGSPEVLTGATSGITAVGADGFRTFFSQKDALFQVATPGHPSMVLLLPNSDEAIAGIAVAGSAIYFSTMRAVYVLAEGIALPLVIGLGGEIRIVGSAIFVLEPRHGRVYRIVLAKGVS